MTKFDEKTETVRIKKGEDREVFTPTFLISL